MKAFLIDRESTLAYKQRNPASASNTAGLLTSNVMEHAVAESDIQSVFRSFKYRLLPSKKQHAALAEILESQRILYNAAKQERDDCYRKTGKGRSYRDQKKALTELRREPEYAAFPLRLQRWTIERVDDAYRGFFRRVNGGGKAGCPRYKSRERWRTFGFAEFSGITLRGGRIRFKGLPSSIRLHLHRALPESKPLCCSFTRDAKGWYVCIQYRVLAVELPSTGRQIGIDVGLKELCVFSSGESVPNPRVAKQAERKLRIGQRALSRCKRGSNRRKKVKASFARLHDRIRNTRATYLHQISARVVRENGLIAMEDLNSGLRTGILAKSVHDAGWGILNRMIAYKAESAGRKFIEVDPKNTTQACGGCGVIVPKTLNERWHSCPHCGLEMDRDHNAAINILRKGVLALGQLNVAGCGERVAGNLIEKV
jgi:putative transposase